MAPPEKASRDGRAARKDPDLLAFGEQLRARRDAAGLTQEDLAHAAGLHTTYIGQIERGERNLTYKNVLRLAWGLDVPPSEIVPQELLKPSAPEPELSKAQEAMVALLAEGKSAREIAASRKTSTAAVQATLRRACKAVGVSGTDELAAWARQRG